MVNEYQSPIDYRITRVPVDVPDKNTMQNFRDIYDFAFAVISGLVKYCGIGTIDPSLWNTLLPRNSIYSGNLNKIYLPCNTSYVRGQFISVAAVSGVLTAVVANANSAVGPIARADGFATNNYNAGDFGEFILNTGIRSSGTVVVPGQRYWLGDLGGVRTTPLTTAGNLEQYLGVAVGNNNMFTALGPAIQH